VYIEDKSGNGDEFTFTINKPDVVITARTPAGAAVTCGKTVSTDVIVTLVSNVTGVNATATVTRDGVAITWPTDGKFTENGQYRILASAGNTPAVAFCFRINRCSGVLTARAAGHNLSNGGFTSKNVKVTLAKGKKLLGVTLNGKEAKAGAEVKIGDVIEIRYGEKRNRYEVVSISEHAPKAEAPEMYKALP
jgi:hypothetical protein